VRGAALLALLANVAALSPAWAGDPVRTTLKVGPRHNIDAVLHTPDGPGPFPGILLLPTSRGFNVADDGYCHKLALEGYICLVADYERAHGVTDATRSLSFGKDAQAINMDLVAVRSEMQSLPKIRPDSIGTIGFSNGGYFAIWLAATHQTRASVAYYPALGPVSNAPRLGRLEHNFSSASAPLLILHGTTDHIPVTAVQNVEKAMIEAGAPHEIKIYQYTGHEFDRDFSQPGNQAAAADAWQRTKDFFKRTLQ
jgi:carboxymethylenebutenolidase